MNVGKPINVAYYAERYAIDEPAAVLALTGEIRHRLEKLVINTPTEEEDELARNIEAIYKEQLWDSAPLAATAHEKEFLLTRGIVKSINYFCLTQPERVAATRQKIRNYMLQLHRLHLQDTLLSQGKRSVLWQSIRLTAYLVLGLPVYVFGLLHNYVPYIIPSKLARAVTKEEEWYAPIMLTAGIFAFPLAYIAEVWLFLELWQPSVPALLLYLLSLPLSGFFALHYWSTLKHTQAHWTLLRLFSKRQLLVDRLEQQRQEIRQELEQARQEYLREINLHQKTV